MMDDKALNPMRSHSLLAAGMTDNSPHLNENTEERYTGYDS